MIPYAMRVPLLVAVRRVANCATPFTFMFTFTCVLLSVGIIKVRDRVAR